MMNWEERKRRLEIFEDTLRGCEGKEELMKCIEYSRENTVLWENPIVDIDVGNRRFDKPCRICVMENQVVEEMRRLCGEFSKLRIGVFHFVSPVHSGGSVIRGGQGQEEKLCRCTTLYPCLDTEYLRGEFYEKNRLCQDGVYSDRCIYIPGIFGVKKDGETIEWLEEKERYCFDVICTVAPKVRDWRVLEHRVDAVFRVAIRQKVDVMTLGISRCGTLGKDTKCVIELYQRIAQQYAHFFRAVYLIS